MKTKGFTLLEFLAGLAVICLILIIAFPMHAMRARKTEQVNVKNQLHSIWESESTYRSRHGTYTADASKLANWKQRTKKYYFRIRHASSTRFVAEANGDLNNDKIFDDTWTINENGVLTNVK
ncbi:MAG TPA: hypothetical protein DDZ40_10350 [Deltaproteobacteria bacterium]|nr:hypothetical protein [Deltaproteobacteria bacterium]